MIQRLLLITTLSFHALSATEEFSIESMKPYLTKENPYIYSALVKKSISQEQLHYVEGEYDTKVVAKYDEKKYPVTEGSYYSVSLEKPTELGIDLSLGYRYAEGTQEYNNIKTGDNGEFILGAMIPLVSVLNQIDQRRLRLSLAQMNLQNTEYAYKEHMRKFYFTLLSEYYTLLYTKGIVDTTKSLVQKVTLREAFIKKSIASGKLSQASIIEVQQQIITRKRALLSAQRAYENRLTNFLKYLNLTQENFNARYHLASLIKPVQKDFDFKEALEHAIQKRPDLQMIQMKIDKLQVENKNNERLQYPEFDVGLYGVYDVNNESGFKVSLNMRFPLAQTQYSSKNAQIRESINMVRNEKKIQLLELTSDLQNIITSLNIVTKNIEAVEEEIQLLQKLESLEKRKYELGSSSLFLLNQREIQTTLAQKKALEYILEYQLLHQSYIRIINKGIIKTPDSRIKYI